MRLFSPLISDTCSDLLRKQTKESDCLSRAAGLAVGCFFSFSDPVGRHIDYATKTQTEDKLGSTWLDNHHSTFILKRWGGRASDDIREHATEYGKHQGWDSRCSRSRRKTGNGGLQGLQQDAERWKFIFQEVFLMFFASVSIATD